MSPRLPDGTPAGGAGGTGLSGTGANGGEGAGFDAGTGDASWGAWFALAGYGLARFRFYRWQNKDMTNGRTTDG